MMIEDIVEFAVAAAVDIEIEKAAKKKRWVYVLRGFVSLILLALIVGAIYITFKYS